MVGESDDGLIFAAVLDGRGGAREIGWDELERWDPSDGFVWSHMDHAAERTRIWLERTGLSEALRESLLAEEPRPRSLALNEGLLAILRGINHNPGDTPEDMVALRVWIDSKRAITLRHRRLLSVRDVRESLMGHSGPRSPGELLVDLTDTLTARISDSLAELEENVDDIEDTVLSAESHQLRSRIANLRRQSIGLRRYLAPQRDAMAHLQVERVPWLVDVDRTRLREVADRMARFIEDLDSTRDRATVVSEELNMRLSEALNRRMYLLSIVAAIFLPLSLLTGLLGINVGGIPGANAPQAFAVVCVLVLSVAVALWGFFRYKRLL